jgi:DHA1 family inner membrane transport protein
MRLPLFALAVAAFAIGTTEFVVMGLLPEVAGDLHVGIPQAGLLISGYAMGVVVGGPILAACAAYLAPKQALLALMAIFIAGNGLCAVAPDYGWLMAARVAAAFTHGSFFGTAALVATRLVPHDKQAQAIGLMFAGLTIANIVGVPAGTWLGQQLGWRSTFVAVAMLGVLALAAIARYVPVIAKNTRPDPLAEIRVLGRLQVWLALAMTVFGFGGVFTVFTYIAPILRDVAGVPARWVSPILTLFGLGATLGTVGGGRLADWKLMRWLTIQLTLLILLFLVFSQVMSSAPLAIAGVFLIGLIGLAGGPALQTRCLRQAGDAPLLVSVLNQSAFNLGNAGGAFIGSRLLDSGHGYPALGIAAAVLATIGLLLTLISAALDRRSAPAVSG